MSLEKKKRRPLSYYHRQILRYIDEYKKATGESGEDLSAVAEWAVLNMEWEPPKKTRPAQILAKDLARASAQDFITDENGNPVRRRHSCRDKDRQMTFWFKIEDATPQQMRTSAQERRRGALADVLQIDRDLSYYNKHHNPGDPIQMSFDFNEDVRERHLPTDYPDAPPDEDDPGSPASN